MKVGLLLLKKLQGARHHYLFSYLLDCGESWCRTWQEWGGHCPAVQSWGVPAALCTWTQRGPPLPPVPPRGICPAERCQCSAERAPCPHITGKERICGVLQSLECSCYLLPSADKCQTLLSHTQHIQMHLPGFSRVFHALPVLKWDEDHTIICPGCDQEQEKQSSCAPSATGAEQLLPAQLLIAWHSPTPEHSCDNEKPGVRSPAQESAGNLQLLSCL